MTGLTYIDGLRIYAHRYDAMLCDAWGVIHNGVRLFPGVIEAMLRFREECGPLIILTNAPRPWTIIPAQLDRIGLPREAYDGIVTSGDATRAEIKKRLPAPAYRIGPSKDDPLFQDLPIEFAPLDRAEFIICTGLVDDRAESPDAYEPLLRDAAERALPMICANPDIVVNWGGRMIWCAGALAEIYERLGGSVVYGGKPHGAIYRLAAARIEESLGSPPTHERILVVGDGVKTDIVGANNQGYDAILITGDGGVHHHGEAEAPLEKRLRDNNVSIVAAMEGLRW